MSFLLTFSSLLAAAGMVAATWLRGWSLPESVSSTIYELPRRLTCLWTAWMMAIAFPIAPPLIEALPDQLRAIGFLTILLLLFVAAWPLVESYTVKAHYVAAVLVGILSQVCVAIISPWWLVMWPLWLFGYILRRGLLTAEAICFATLIGALAN